MQQTRKTSFLQSLFAARRQARPARSLQPLDQAALRRVAGGEGTTEFPKGGW